MTFSRGHVFYVVENYSPAEGTKLYSLLMTDDYILSVVILALRILSNLIIGKRSFSLSVSS